ncbi:hypothetical protein CR513_50184, partial [Mucuna pruriens]
MNNTQALDMNILEEMEGESNFTKVTINSTFAVWKDSLCSPDKVKQRVFNWLDQDEATKYDCSDLRTNHKHTSNLVFNQVFGQIKHRATSKTPAKKKDKNR